MEPNPFVEKMMQNDAFSQWLRIVILKAAPGICKLKMTVRSEMTNGFGIAHGGIVYSLADSALAFASNAHGTQAVSIETSISHTRPIQVGDTLFAVAEEKNSSRQFGIYDVKITNQDLKTVALFKGTVFKTNRE